MARKRDSSKGVNDRKALRAWFRKWHGDDWSKDPKLRAAFDARLGQIRGGITASQRGRRKSKRARHNGSTIEGASVMPAMGYASRIPSYNSLPNGLLAAVFGTPAPKPVSLSQDEKQLFVASIVLAAKHPAGSGGRYLIHAPKQEALFGVNSRGSAWYWLEKPSLRSFESTSRYENPVSYMPDYSKAKAMQTAKGNAKALRTPSIVVIDAFTGTVDRVALGFGNPRRRR